MPHDSNLIMTRKLIKIPALLILLNSCINMNDPEKQAEYIQSLNSFNPRLVAILPDRIPNNMVTMGYSSLFNLKEYDNPAGLRMTIKISSRNEYNDLKSQFKNKALYAGLPSDTCLTIIGSSEHEIRQATCDSTFPIPHHSVFRFNESKQNWEQRANENIYIIDYQVGNLISTPTNDASETNTVYSNGFSTGINANDDNQTIQYWMINW